MAAPVPDYWGLNNEDLECGITTEELRAVLNLNRKKSSPGLDNITAKILCSLDDCALQKLTDYLNSKCWIAGSIPFAWKTAEIRFIPKINKEVNNKNLRLISLTLYVGKLFERVVKTRLGTS